MTAGEVDVVRRWLGSLVVLAIGVAVLVGCTPPNSITGVVTDTDGAPVVGAVVEAYPSWSGSAVRTTTTDAAGAYTLADLAPGFYNVRVVPPSGAPRCPTSTCPRAGRPPPTCCLGRQLPHGVDEPERRLVLQRRGIQPDR